MKCSDWLHKLARLNPAISRNKVNGKARYAPRIEAGVPAETDGMVFRERMLIKASRE